MMSTTAPQTATTPISVQLSAPAFEAFLLPHLSMPKRGPKCKLSYYRVFNLIVRVLYTGMQWKCPHSSGFLRNNRLRVDTPLPLRLCLCFGTQGHPIPDEEERRRLPADYAARSTVTV